jgi:hypothetical protein
MKAKPTRRRRTGATETIGVSLDLDTKQKLKALAEERHQGNVSALITELAEAAVRQAAFDRAWAWYGGPEPTAARAAAIDAEMEEGWALARKVARKSARKRPAA